MMIQGMGEKERNLATLQNICVMAFADGEINAAEKRLIQDLARSMQLTEVKLQEILDHVATLSFQIPTDQEDREHELRMAVLTVITDGEITNKEYEVLLSFARQMEFKKEYVDEVITFYTEKQLERLRNLEFFQNLYLLALADGNIDPREEAYLQEIVNSLGIYKEDLEYIYKESDHLELIIPEEESEQVHTLKNLVYMMMIDEELHEAEYALCLKFAQHIGYGEEKISLIINEFEKMMQQQETEAAEVLKNNIDLYLDLFNKLKAQAFQASELAQCINWILKSKNFQLAFADDREKNRSFYELFWLAYFHAVKLNPEILPQLPVCLDQMIEKHSFQELQNLLLKVEEQYGFEPIPLSELSLSTLQTDLENFWDALIS